MKEKMPPFSNNLYSRRKILTNLGRAAAGGLVYAALSHGIHENPPEIKKEPFTMNYDLVTLLQQAEVDQGIQLSSQDKLFIETNFDFFSNQLEQAHRAGNSREGFEEAVQQKAQVIDIDALDDHGTVYAEHGFIPGIDILGHHFSSGLVIDPEELELRMHEPDKLHMVLRRIGQRSTPELPLGAKIEFKRGPFEESTVNGVLEDIEEYNVPSVILTRGHNQYERTNKIRIVRNLENVALIGLKAA